VVRRVKGESLKGRLKGETEKGRRESCLCQNGAEMKEKERRREREKERERPSGGRQRASEVSEQIETFSPLESRLPCEVAGYIALSCKHALTASSRRRRPSSPFSATLVAFVSTYRATTAAAAAAATSFVSADLGHAAVDRSTAASLNDSLFGGHKSACHVFAERHWTLSLAAIRNSSWYHYSRRIAPFRVTIVFLPVVQWRSAPYSML